MFTVFDVATISSVTFDNESKYITVQQSGNVPPVHISPDDELYEYHLRTVNELKTQVEKSFLTDDQLLAHYEKASNTVKKRMEKTSAKQ